MRVEPPDIDKAALLQLLQTEYELDVATLTFVPKGMESYSYIAETPARVRYFVKAYDELAPPNLGAAFQAVRQLHRPCGFEFVVPPRETKQGQLLRRFGQYVLAAFDYIESTTPFEDGSADDEDWTKLATMAASLHTRAKYPQRLLLPQERFEITFKDWLLKVLASAEDTAPTVNDYERRARALLTNQQDDVLATLKKLERLAEWVRSMAAEQCLTHGDLTPGNILKDNQGNLYLVDWGKVALGPPERDLTFVTGERFETFLIQYMRACKRPPRLHRELFEYYIYRWILGEIADFGAWILLEDANLAETALAWEELLQYLPIHHGRVQAGVSEIGQALDRLSGS